ncbi:unnamed protein product, partial [Rotaria sp. Silwood1]
GGGGGGGDELSPSTSFSPSVSIFFAFPLPRGLVLRTFFLGNDRSSSPSQMDTSNNAESEISTRSTTTSSTGTQKLSALSSLLE